jgi:hypothetical protein
MSISVTRSPERKIKITLDPVSSKKSTFDRQVEPDWKTTIELSRPVLSGGEDPAPELWGICPRDSHHGSAENPPGAAEISLSLPASCPMVKIMDFPGIIAGVKPVDKDWYCPPGQR